VVVVVMRGHGDLDVLDAEPLCQLRERVRDEAKAGADDVIPARKAIVEEKRFPIDVQHVEVRDRVEDAQQVLGNHVEACVNRGRGRNFLLLAVPAREQAVE
jgi:hypothetical protein